MTEQHLLKYAKGRNPAQASPTAKRSLGQNFLQDSNIAGKIVRCLGIAPGDSVLEIGPGAGALTGFIQDCAPGRLVLVEKDPYWASERMRAGRGGLCVLLADALRLSWERFSAPWKFIGNLPYNVASPLMWDMFSGAPGLRRAVFMMQKEVGLRITAHPGTSAYGALSVWTQSFMRPELEFIVSPGVFRPRPKVDSAVLSFVPVADAGAVAEGFRPRELAATLKACFQMRRKQLGTIARASGHGPDALAAAGFDPKQRPEELSPQEFHRLSQLGIFT